MIGSSKNSRENYPKKCFWTRERETRVKFNPGLSANRLSNNWAQTLLLYVFVDLKAAQRSIAFLAFLLYSPVKRCFNLFRCCCRRLRRCSNWLYCFNPPIVATSLQSMLRWLVYTRTSHKLRFPDPTPPPPPAPRRRWKKKRKKKWVSENGHQSGFFLKRSLIVFEYDDVIHHTAHALWGMLSYFHLFSVLVWTGESYSGQTKSHLVKQATCGLVFFWKQGKKFSVFKNMGIRVHA